jgi:hypothetical protein
MAGRVLGKIGLGEAAAAAPICLVGKPESCCWRFRWLWEHSRCSKRGKLLQKAKAVQGGLTCP